MLPGVAPTGRRVEVPLVAVVRFVDSKVAHEHILLGSRPRCSCRSACWTRRPAGRRRGHGAQGGRPVLAQQRAHAALGRQRRQADLKDHSFRRSGQPSSALLSTSAGGAGGDARGKAPIVTLPLVNRQAFSCRRQCALRRSGRILMNRGHGRSGRGRSRRRPRRRCGIGRDRASWSDTKRLVGPDGSCSSQIERSFPETVVLDGEIPGEQIVTAKGAEGVAGARTARGDPNGKRTGTSKTARSRGSSPGSAREYVLRAFQLLIDSFGDGVRAGFCSHKAIHTANVAYT